MSSQLQPKPPADSLTTMTLMMGVDHGNTAGFVHGGSIMKLVDEAAGVASMRHCRGRVVTAQVDSLSFLAPVHMGDVLSIVAHVSQAWTTSMEVEVEVTRENPRTGDGELTTRAFLTMVAVDRDGHPVEVPPILAETEGELRDQRKAEARRSARMELRSQLELQ